MPLIKLQTSVHISDDQEGDLIASLSRIISECIGKPERYVMATIDETSIMMAGELGNAAFADVRSIGGLNPDVKARLSQKICKLLQESLMIPNDRVYINFADISADNWGWNGSTFG